LARVPYVQRDQMPPDKLGIYDRIASTRGSVQNVFAALLNSPDAAEAVTSMGEYLRYNCPLDPAIRETAILATAREMGNRYEWAQHEPVAREVGVRDEVIEAIRSGKAPMGLPAKEGVFAQGARELTRDGALTERTLAAIEHLLGTRQAVDFVVLVSYYGMVARIISTFQVDFDEWLDPETGF
jgi:4-carboxymuconolactone decarboxylase